MYVFTKYKTFTTLEKGSQYMYLGFVRVMLKL